MSFPRSRGLSHLDAAGWHDLSIGNEDELHALWASSPTDWWGGGLNALYHLGSARTWDSQPGLTGRSLDAIWATATATCGSPATSRSIARTRPRSST